MKNQMKVIKIIAMILAIPLLLAAIGATYIHFSGIPNYDNQAPRDYPVKIDSFSVAEGVRMASNYVCKLPQIC